MKNDEYNKITINNEKDGFSSFEFGNVQDAEYTFFADNKNNIRDEINDNVQSNSENQKEDERKKEEQTSSNNRNETNNSSSSSSEGASGASAASVGATVGAVTVVVVGALTGLNILFSGRCNNFEAYATESQISYYLELDGVKEEDICYISLDDPTTERDDPQFERLTIGPNQGSFSDLLPDTKYVIRVVDETENQYVMLETTMSTKPYYGIARILDPVATTDTIQCMVELSDSNEDDEYAVLLKGKGRTYTYAIEEGENEVSFSYLAHSTEYRLSVVDVTHRNYEMDYYILTTATPGATHVVTFSMNGGSDVPSQTIDDGGFVTEPDEPTKEGYLFEGWYTDWFFEERFDFGTPIYNDLNLIANWVEYTSSELNEFYVEYIDVGDSTDTPGIGYYYELTSEEEASEPYTLKITSPGNDNEYEEEITLSPTGEDGEEVFLPISGDLAAALEDSDKVFAYSLYSDDYEPVITGSFSAAKAKKKAFHAIYVGNSVLKSEGILPCFCMYVNTATVAFTLDISDFEGAYGSTYTFKYTLNSSGEEGSVELDATRASQLANFSWGATSGLVTLSSCGLYDENDNLISDLYTDVTFVFEDDPTIYSFYFTDTTFARPYYTGIYLYSDCSSTEEFNAESITVTVRFEIILRNEIVKELYTYNMQIGLSSPLNTDLTIDLTSDPNVDYTAMLEALKHYACDVTLIYTIDSYVYGARSPYNDVSFSYINNSSH